MRLLLISAVLGLSQAAAITSADASIAYLTNWSNSPADFGLYTLQAGTASVTRVGDLGITDPITGMTWDRAHGVMYGVSIDSSLNSGFYRVDLPSGHATLIGPTGISRAGGLAVSPTSGIMYGVSYDGQVFRVDPTTGVGTPIGPASGVNLEGLTFAPDGRAIAGVGIASGGGLFTIDLQTGAQTRLFSGPTLSGIGVDPADGQLYGIDNYIERAYRIDLTTGAYTTLGFIPLLNPKSLAFVPGPSPAIAWVMGVGLGVGLRSRRPKRTS